MSGKLENRRVLVTGGAGFIGSNLVDELLSGGNEVVCLDNFSTGLRSNIEPYLGNVHFRLIEGDIRDRKTCAAAVDGVEYVFHQAALGSVPRSINDPVSSTEVNVAGFVNMLYAAKEAKVKRVIYASSSSVYGDSMNSPKVEDIIGKTISPYALTKYVDELFAENFNRVYGIETVGLRYFNVFGRRQTPYSAYAAVIPKFALELISHRSPVINGDGTISRDFTYVMNVVQANQLAALATGSEAVNTVYNIACGSQASILHVFEQLRGNLSQFDSAISGIEPVFGPERQGDVPFSLADIGKAKSLLGYNPSHDFEQGLREAASWYWDTLRQK